MVNGITQVTALQGLEQTNTDTKKKDKTAAQTTSYSDKAAEYVASDTKSLKELAGMSESDRASVIEKMKADVDARTSQLRDLVEKMFLQQGDASSVSKSMWKRLADGGLVTDEDAAKKAQEDIAENGYWGVTQTSDRIMSFAVALSGGDNSKMQDMMEAFKKGYEQATGAWGKELPALCKDTYDAVLKKFNDYLGSDSSTTATT